jgi:SAM-dependent methyltransferase
MEGRLRLGRLLLDGLAAHVLFTANELGIFALLAREGPSTAGEAAGHLGVSRVGMERLLGALVSMGLLEHMGDRFGNGPAVEELLVPGVPGSMAGWVSVMDRWASQFASLAESVRTGRSSQLAEDHLGGSADKTRQFMLGMHDYALGPGSELARHLDLTGRRRLLDVGGGPGTYSILLAEANPDLECVVFERPGVAEIALEVVARHGLAPRISTVSGDYHDEAFPDGFDAVLISNVLHQEDRSSCLDILAKSRASLTRGGLVIVQGMFLNDRGDGPLWPALLNLLMLLMYPSGRAWSTAETVDMLKEAGFEDIRPHGMSTFNAEAFVTAEKP